MEGCLTLLSDLSTAKILAVDTETNGEDIRDGRGYLIGVSICGKVNGEIRSGYLPFRHLAGGNLPSECLDALRHLLESPVPKIFHNYKFDIVSLPTIGITLDSTTVFCSLKMAHLINENLFSYKLNSVAAYFLGPGPENQKDMSEEMKKFLEEFGWAWVPVEMMIPYAVRDAELLYRLAEKLWPLFLDEGLMDYWKHKQEFVDVIIAMESLGVRIDTALCEEQAAIGEARMAEIIEALGGYSPGSSGDLKVLLIDKLGLPIYKVSEKTKKPSFDKFAMEYYDDDLKRMNSPMATLILEYRGWQKTVTSNYKPYLTLLSPDGNLRPNYKLHGTKTGRMSCEKPNLQQIPRVSSKPWNGHLKRAFIPRDGYSLYEADYSQLELRLSAAYAKEDSLKEIFAEGRDIFTEMSQVLQMTRQDTKTFVYSTQYGAGVRRIKTALGVAEATARQIRENYFIQYPGLKLVSDRAQGMARTHGKIKLWAGRWRHFRSRDEEAHKAFNSIIQGGAADIVEKVMVKLYQAVHNDECRMLLQVHDSVVFEIKNGREDFYRDRIVKIMEDVDAITAPESFDVKFHVEFKRWGEG